jgi:thiol-disulfide isomerase/thioredoxin
MAFNNENIVYFENGDFDEGGVLKEESLDSSKPVLIMIYGTQCPHCHTVMPDYIKLARDSASSAIYGTIVVDGAEADADLVKRLPDFIPNLQGVPTFVLYRNGRYIKTHQGARNAAALLQFVNT